MYGRIFVRFMMGSIDELPAADIDAGFAELRRAGH